MELKQEIVSEYPNVQVLHVIGEVDHSNYRCLMNIVRQEQSEALIVDLTNCPSISLAGGYALFSLACWANHRLAEPADYGWEALHKMAEKTNCLKAGFKLIRPSNAVASVLQRLGLWQALDVSADLPTALAKLNHSSAQRQNCSSI